MLFRSSSVHRGMLTPAIPLVQRLLYIGMQLEAEERAILATIARRLDIAPDALVDAIERESAPELATLLRVDEAEAAARLEPIRRVVTVESDWGAGCRLLTDDLRMDLRRALHALLPADHSASFGVSQG